MSLFKVSKEELLKRLKSFGWRIGMMVLAALIGFIIDNLGVLNLTPEVIGVIGLVLGEISKQINKNLQELKGMAGK